MKTNLTKTRGFTLVELLVVITIIASLAGIATPQVFKQLRKADMAVATSNAKQIGMSMFEFCNEYGTFPSEATAATLTANFPGAAVTGGTTNANDYFRQLFHAGIVQSEEIFFAKTTGSIKPDGNASTTQEALKPGEVGFGYIYNSTSPLSTSYNPSLTIAATPFAATGSATQFDTIPFDKKAVLLRIDNSVSQQTIAVTGSGTVGNVNVGGKDVLTDPDLWTSGTPSVAKPAK